jgi:hypothetical protein
MSMDKELKLKIIGTDRRDGDAVIIEYSDHSTVTYTTEQLATLTPASRETKSGPLGE